MVLSVRKYNNMQNKIFTIFVVLVATGVLSFVLLGSQRSTVQNFKNVSQDLNSYKNDMYGVSFTYPKELYLEEKEVGNAERGHYVVSLTENTDTNKKLREGGIVGEGPTAITLDIFQNNIEKTLPVDWMNGVSYSNFKLSNGLYATTSIAGVTGYMYDWDGLYRGHSIVFAHKENIVMISVTSLTPEDKLLKDFQTIISSLSLI